jgi:hypothetical protein
MNRVCADDPFDRSELVEFSLGVGRERSRGEDPDAAVRQLDGRAPTADWEEVEPRKRPKKTCSEELEEGKDCDALGEDPHVLRNLSMGR